MAITKALDAAGVTEDDYRHGCGAARDGLTQVLALERALGATTGHDATLEFVERTLDRLGSTSSPDPRRIVAPLARSDAGIWYPRRALADQASMAAAGAYRAGLSLARAWTPSPEEVRHERRRGHAAEARPPSPATKPTQTRS